MRAMSKVSRNGRSAGKAEGHQAIEEFLGATDLFGGVSIEGRRSLAGIAMRRPVAKGQRLFLEGTPGQAVYLLISGSVQIHKESSAGKEAILHFIKPGEIFAEVVLFESDKYPASAVALQKSEVLALPRDRLLALLDDPSFRADFIAMLMGKLRYLTRQIHILRSHDVAERFCLFLEEHYGRESLIRPELTKREVASALGITPEAFSRLLLRLRRQKLLTWNPGAISVSPGFWKIALTS